MKLEIDLDKRGTRGFFKSACILFEVKISFTIALMAVYITIYLDMYLYISYVFLS